MLEVRNLNVWYGVTEVLRNVSFAVPANKIVALLGGNGSGKTTILNALSGLVAPRGGSIAFEGTEVAGWTTDAMVRQGVVQVPQGREVFPSMTVRENLETGFGCLPSEEHVVPDQIYELFPVLKEMQNRRGGDLSGGQQQQLAIGRALITKPKLLLLDEPTEGIQPNIIQQIGRVIEYLRDQGDMAILLVEQYFDFAYGLADGFYALRRGAVVLSGAKDDVGRDAMLEAVSV